MWRSNQTSCSSWRWTSDKINTLVGSTCGTRRTSVNGETDSSSLWAAKEEPISWFGQVEIWWPVHIVHTVGYRHMVPSHDSSEHMTLTTGIQLQTNHSWPEGPETLTPRTLNVLFYVQKVINYVCSRELASQTSGPGSDWFAVQR